MASGRKLLICGGLALAGLGFYLSFMNFRNLAFLLCSISVILLISSLPKV
jgi:hypothetical protein